MTLTLIWAESKNGVIGNENKLPWHIKKELEHFKRTTLGHTVVFGYNTVKGFNGRLLDGRDTILFDPYENADIFELGLENTPIGQLENFTIANKEEILELAKTQEVFIAGGKATYDAFLLYADKIIRTIVEENYQGDTYAPHFTPRNFIKTEVTLYTDNPNWKVEVYKRYDY